MIEIFSFEVSWIVGEEHVDAQTGGMCAVDGGLVEVGLEQLDHLAFVLDGEVHNVRTPQIVAAVPHAARDVGRQTRKLILKRTA